MSGPQYRFIAGDFLRIRTISSNATALSVDCQVMYDNGNEAALPISHTPNSNRTVATSGSSRLGDSGWLVGVEVEVIGGGVKRGENWGQLQIINGNTNRVRHAAFTGYIHDEGSSQLGFFESSTDGKGFLHWVQEANDAAGNVTTTVNLAVTNAHRIVRAILVKYHASGDAATRTITITLRDLATAAGPTGWSIASDTWTSPTLTLTVNEEGLMHVGEHGFLSTNDAGTLAYADNTSAPNPFPLELEDGETADLIIVAGLGEAADDYDVWVQYEDWIEV